MLLCQSVCGITLSIPHRLSSVNVMSPSSLARFPPAVWFILQAYLLPSSRSCPRDASLSPSEMVNISLILSLGSLFGCLGISLLGFCFSPVVLEVQAYC